MEFRVQRDQPGFRRCGAGQSHHVGPHRAILPIAYSRSLAAKRFEVPEQDRIAREHELPRFLVSVTNWFPVDCSGERALDQPAERDPTRVIERDDEFSPSERHVDPLAIGGIQNPRVLIANRLNARTLLFVADLHPTGLPRELVGLVPRDARQFSKPTGKRRFSAARHAINQDALITNAAYFTTSLILAKYSVKLPEW